MSMDKIATDNATNLNALIKDIKGSASSSIGFGILLFILSTLLLAGVVFLDSPDKIERYILVVIAGTSFIGSFILFQSYANARKEIGMLQVEFIVMRDMQIADLKAGELPEEKCKEEKETTSIKNTITTEKKGIETVVNKEFVFPQQRARQLIIETLMSRCSK